MQAVSLPPELLQRVRATGGNPEGLRALLDGLEPAERELYGPAVGQHLRPPAAGRWWLGALLSALILTAWATGWPIFLFDAVFGK